MHETWEPPDSPGDRAALREALEATPTLRAHGTPSRDLAQRVVTAAAENARRSVELRTRETLLAEREASLLRRAERDEALLMLSWIVAACGWALLALKAAGAF